MLISERRIQLDSDTRLFALAGSYGEPLAGPPTPDNSLVRFDSARDPDWIVVSTGSQSGPFDVTVREHDAEGPAPDGEPWEDVVELSVQTPAAGLVLFEIEGGDVTDVVDRGGRFRLRISASGRARGLALDDEEPEGTPVEHYLVDVWPGDLEPAGVVTGCGPLEPPRTRVEDLPEYAAGVEGSRSIGRDLDGAPGCRVLSGRRGDLEVERIVPWTPRRLFPMFAFSTGWVRSHARGGAVESTGTAFASSILPVAEGGDGLTGRDGHILLTLLDVKRPRTSRMEWNWCFSPDGRRSAAEDKVPFLDPPTTFETELRPLSDHDGPRCLARIRHRDLPIEWIQPMTDYWRLHLAVVEMRATARAAGGPAPGSSTN